jgi:hypothetical protein
LGRRQEADIMSQSLIDLGRQLAEERHAHQVAINERDNWILQLHLAIERIASTYEIPEGANRVKTLESIEMTIASLLTDLRRAQANEVLPIDPMASLDAYPEPPKTPEAALAWREMIGPVILGSELLRMNVTPTGAISIPSSGVAEGERLYPTWQFHWSQRKPYRFVDRVRTELSDVDPYIVCAWAVRPTPFLMERGVMLSPATWLAQYLPFERLLAEIERFKTMLTL